jgi:hypothetical protein
MAVMLTLAGLSGLLAGYLVASTRIDEVAALRYVEGVQRGRELADLGVDLGPVEAARLQDGREVHPWKSTLGQDDLHRELQRVGVGL